MLALGNTFDQVFDQDRPLVALLSALGDTPALARRDPTVEAWHGVQTEYLDPRPSRLLPRTIQIDRSSTAKDLELGALGGVHVEGGVDYSVGRAPEVKHEQCVVVNGHVDLLAGERSGPDR